MGPLAVTVAVYLWTMASVQGADTPTHFTNMWIAEIHGGEEVAQRVARDLGYKYEGQAGRFKDHYVFLRDDHPEVSTRDSSHLTKGLMDLDEVKWAEQQYHVRLSQRGDIPLGRKPGDDANVPSCKGEPNQNVKMSKQEELMEVLKETGMSTVNINRASVANAAECGHGAGLLDCLKLPPNLMNFLVNSVQGDLTRLGTFSTKPVDKRNLDTYTGPTKHIDTLSHKISAYALMFNDPLWKRQWYMQDYRTKDMPVMDHNIVPVYKMGYSGKGVYVAVVDDGVQGKHSDLVDNFDETLSYDYCNNKIGCEPDFNEWDTPSHGTMCAGIIAMGADNRWCGVGVAHKVTFGGIRVLCVGGTPYIESRSLVHKLEKYDIYTNSYGPTDDGVTYITLNHLLDLAIRTGVTEGRKGKGVIYVFSSGNGRVKYDNCAADSYINHFGTIGIAAVDQRGKMAYYSERCTAVFAAAYSQGNATTSEGVVTSYINEYCTTGFSGTSAATPLAAGILALVLEANPELTYRDVMHLIAWTSEVAPVANNEDSWYRNGRGLWVSNDFGFGLLNAENMVTAALGWKNVPEKHTCVITVTLKKPLTIGLLENAVIPFETKACQGSKTDSVSYLEDIQIAAKVVYPYRGGIAMKITSPEGTESDILEHRINDNVNTGLNGYIVKSVHNWGESPRGKWKLEVKGLSLIGLRGASGYISEFTLTMHGTEEKPAHYSKPRTYAAFRLPDGKTMDTKKANKAK